MGCGCKKKPPMPVQAPAHIVLTEQPRPPQPIQPPEQQKQEVDKIVEKLNDILTPH